LEEAGTGSLEARTGLLGGSWVEEMEELLKHIAGFSRSLRRVPRGEECER